MGVRALTDKDFDLSGCRLLASLGASTATISDVGDLTLGSGNAFIVDPGTGGVLRRISSADWTAGSHVILRASSTFAVTGGSSAGGGFYPITVPSGLSAIVQTGALAIFWLFPNEWVLLEVTGGGSTGPWEQVLIDPRGTFTTTANLLANPGFEDSPILWIQGLYSAAFAQLYSTYPGMFPDGNPPDRGLKYAVGGPYTSHSPVTLYQEIDVSSYSTEIDTGKSKCNAEAWLGGFEEHVDTAELKVTFRDGEEVAISSFTIGPVTAAQRNYATLMLKRKASATVPIGTRQLLTEIIFTYGGDISDIRAYADNVSVTLTVPDEPELVRDLGTVVSLVDDDPATSVLSDWQYRGANLGWTQIHPSTDCDNGQEAATLDIDGGVLDIGLNVNVVANGAGPLMWIEKSYATPGVTVVAISAGEADIALVTDVSVPTSGYGYLVFPDDEPAMALRQGYEARFRLKGTHWLYIGGTR